MNCIVLYIPVNRCDLTRWMRDFPPPCKTPSIPSGTIYGERSRDVGPVPGARYSRWERPIIGVNVRFLGCAGCSGRLRWPRGHGRGGAALGGGGGGALGVPPPM